MEEKIVELVASLGTDAIGVAYAFVAVKAFEIIAVGVLAYLLLGPMARAFTRMISENID